MQTSNFDNKMESNVGIKNKIATPVTETRMVKFNVTMHGRRAGDVVPIKFADGIALERNIRRRIADADGSVEIIESPKENIDNIKNNAISKNDKSKKNPKKKKEEG